MIAPVDGSGGWPPWMTRVSKPCFVVSLLIGMSRSCKRLAKVVQDVESRDQTIEAGRIGDDRDPALLQRRDQRLQAGVGPQRAQLAVHRLAHRLAGSLGVAGDGA